jgi:hypothetical protein
MVLLGRAEIVVVDDRWLKAKRWMTIWKAEMADCKQG